MTKIEKNYRKSRVLMRRRALKQLEGQNTKRLHSGDKVVVTGGPDKGRKGKIRYFRGNNAYISGLASPVPTWWLEKTGRSRRKALKQVNPERIRYQESKRKAKAAWVTMCRAHGLSGTVTSGFLETLTKYWMDSIPRSELIQEARRVRAPMDVVDEFVHRVNRL